MPGPAGRRRSVLIGTPDRSPLELVEGTDERLIGATYDPHFGHSLAATYRPFGPGFNGGQRTVQRR